MPMGVGRVGLKVASVMRPAAALMIVRGVNMASVGKRSNVRHSRVSMLQAAAFGSVGTV